jgi:uncharacterized protein with NRDE domain
VHAFSNAPEGEEWPKTAFAIERLRHALANATVEALIDELMLFLRTPRGIGEIASEVFIAGERYGTRSSTVVVMTPGELVFAEQSYARGGDLMGARRSFVLEP